MSICSLNAFLTGAIIAKMPATCHWTGVTGQGNLSITARDEAAIGELMLDDGVVHGQRILNHDWIARSLASQVAISPSDPYADFYGYMSYTKAEPVGSDKIEVHFGSAMARTRFTSSRRFIWL
jgi:CubicO group peptidase (beta-lactamase class C family)